MNGPEANNRFLSVKCKQWTGVLLVGYDPSSKVSLFDDPRLSEKKSKTRLVLKK